MQFLRTLGMLATIVGLASAVPASARPHVVSSTPTAAATVSNVRTVTITFDEALMPALSGLEIIMTGMPGMAGHHPAMKIPGVKIAVGADRKSLVATVPHPLPAGTYDVVWHAAGGDNDRATGVVSFTAR